MLEWVVCYVFLGEEGLRWVGRLGIVYMGIFGVYLSNVYRGLGTSGSACWLVGLSWKPTISC